MIDIFHTDFTRRGLFAVPRPVQAVLNILTPRSISQMRACIFSPMLCREAPDPLKSELRRSGASLHSTGKNVPF